MRRPLLPLLLLPLAAHAQPAPQQPEMVLLPRQLAETAAQWISAPDATTAVRIFAALQACLADNPQGGRLTRQGQDQCPAVTAALAARDKELADAKAAAAKSAEAPKAAEPTKP